MSNIYVQEPPTYGKVLLVTSVGDIDIELWSKEAPKACRNFVQLCMEGYYDGTTFFRVVRNFIVQGGDPTNTGQGGESIYGKPFRDEFHTRLRFVRRGLVAMANAGPDDNGSQFFFTLASTPELSKKHTIFGRVAGNTIFNMVRLGEVATGKDDRPINPLKIIRTEVLDNPFDDIIPRASTKDSSEEKTSARESSSGAMKNFSLLSFGEEAEEDEEEVTKANENLRHKSKSSHDILNDSKLSAVPAVDMHPTSSVNTESEDLSEDNDNKQDKKTKSMKTADSKAKTHEEEDEKKKWRLQGETSEKIKGIFRAKEKLLSSAVMSKEIAKPQQLKGKDREHATLKLLEKFKSKLEAVKQIPEDVERTAEGEEKLLNDGDTKGGLTWTNHRLQFEEKEHKVIDANVQDSERYEISDPRNPMVVRRRHKEKNETDHKRLKTDK